MDPICHTLVGATLAQAGLGRHTRLTTAAAIIGANLPDVDAVLYVTGDSLYWRRGWTHGVPALIVWPVVLTVLLLAWDRVVRSRRPPDTTPADGRLLLVTSAVAILTHPTLDFLNNYGLRWLMPLSNRWFYGDALFIADPWIWTVLAAGVACSWWVGRRMTPGRGRSRPARVALALVAAYAAMMLVLGQAGRGIVQAQFEARGVRVTREPMVSPVFASIDRRYAVAEAGATYHVSAFRWWPTPTLDGGTRLIARNADHPAVNLARRAPEARGFIGWSRFPFFVVQPDGDGFTVIMDDARYAPPAGDSWAAVRVHVPASAMGADSASHAGLSTSTITSVTASANNRLRLLLAALLKAVPCA